MLTQMNLTNFKSWKQTGDIRLAPLTGFFGANSSGKSSLLQLLLMLKATTESSDRNVLLETNIRDYVLIVTLQDIIYKGGKEIGFSLSFDLQSELKIGGLSLKELSFSATFETRSHGISNTTYLKQFVYRSNNFYVAMDSYGHSSVNNHPFAILSLTTSLKENQAFRPQDTDFTQSNIKSYDFSQEILAPEISDFRKLPRALEQQFNRVYHLGPVRESAVRHYIWGGERPFDVGIRGERSIAILLASGDEMINIVGEWLSKMRQSKSFHVRKIIGSTYQVELTPIGSDHPVLLSDMGFGVSQVLPVLVACYAVPEGATLLIEQPEMHLHASAQSVLADMFIEVMKERKVQLIIESHSEHLLARLQRRMAEKPSDENSYKLDVHDTAFYFCQLRDGESHITPLEMDEYGEIKNYPDDFFGDLAGDVIKRTLASIEQKIELAK